MATLRIDRQLTGSFGPLIQELDALARSTAGLSSGRSGFGAFSQQVAQASRSSRDLARDVDRLDREFDDLNNGLGRVGAVIQTNFSRRVFQGIVRGFREVLGVAAELQDGLNRAGVISGATADELDALSRAAIEAARNTTATTGQVSELAIQLARAGRSAEDAAQLFEPVARAAEVAGESLERIGSIASASLSQFNLPAEDAARVLDLLTFSANSADQSVADLGNALRFAGPIANQYQQEIESVLDSLTGLAQAGIRGSSAGTGLRQAFQALLQPTTEAAAVLQDLEVSIDDGNGNFRDTVEIINDLAAALADETPQVRANILSIIAPNVRGRNVLGTLLQQSIVDTRNFRDELGQSAGIVEDNFNRIQQTFAGSVRELASALDAAAANVGRFFTTILQPVVETFTAITNAFNGLPPLIQDTIAALALLGTSIAAVIAGVVTIQSFLATEIGQRLTQTFRDIRTQVSNVGDSFQELTTDAAGVGDAVDRSFDEATQSVRGAAVSLTNFVDLSRTAGDSVRNDVTTAVRGLDDAVRKVASRPVEFTLNADPFRRSAQEISDELLLLLDDASSQLSQDLPEPFTEIAKKATEVGTSARDATEVATTAFTGFTTGAVAALIVRLNEIVELGRLLGFVPQESADQAAEAVDRLNSLLASIQVPELRLLPPGEIERTLLLIGDVEDRLNQVRALPSGAPPPVIIDVDAVVADIAVVEDTANSLFDRISAGYDRLRAEATAVSGSIRAFGGAFADIEITGLQNLAFSIQELAREVNPGGIVISGLQAIADILRFIISTPDQVFNLGRAVGELVKGLGPIGAAREGISRIGEAATDAREAVQDAAEEISTRFTNVVGAVGQVGRAVNDVREDVRIFGQNANAFVGPFVEAFINATDAIDDRFNISDGIRTEVAEVAEALDEVAQSALETSSAVEELSGPVLGKLTGIAASATTAATGLDQALAESAVSAAEAGDPFERLVRLTGSTTQAFLLLQNTSGPVARALEEGRVSIQGVSEALSRGSSSFRDFSQDVENVFPTLGRLSGGELDAISEALDRAEQEARQLGGALDSTTIFLAAYQQLLLEDAQAAEEFQRQLNTLGNIDLEQLTRQARQANQGVAELGETLRQTEIDNLQNQVNRLQDDLVIGDDTFITGLETDIINAGDRLQEFIDDVNQADVDLFDEIGRELDDLLREERVLEIRAENEAFIEARAEYLRVKAQIEREAIEIQIADVANEIQEIGDEIDALETEQLERQFREAAIAAEAAADETRRVQQEQERIEADRVEALGQALSTLDDRARQARGGIRAIDNSVSDLTLNGRQFGNNFLNLFTNQLPGPVQAFADTLGDTVFDNVQRLGGGLTGIRNLAAGLAPVISGIATATAGFVGPIVALGAGVAVLVRAFQQAREQVRDNARDFGQLSSITESLGELFQSLRPIIAGLIDGLAAIIAPAIVAGFQVLDSTVAAVSVTLSGLAEAISLVAEGLDPNSRAGLGQRIGSVVFTLGAASVAVATLLPTILGLGSALVAAGAAAVASSAGLATFATTVALALGPVGAVTVAATALTGALLGLNEVRLDRLERETRSLNEQSDRLASVLNSVRAGSESARQDLGEFRQEQIRLFNAGEITAEQLAESARLYNRLSSEVDAAAEASRGFTLTTGESAVATQELVNDLKQARDEFEAFTDRSQQFANLFVTETENILEVQQARLDLTREQLSENDQEIQQLQSLNDQGEITAEQRARLVSLLQDEASTLRELQREEIALQEETIGLDRQRAILQAEANRASIEAARQEFEIAQAQRRLDLAVLREEAAARDDASGLQRIEELERENELADALRATFDQRLQIEDQLLASELQRLEAIADINVERRQEAAEAELLEQELQIIAALDLDRIDAVERLIDLTDETGESLVDSRQEAEALVDQLIDANEAAEETLQSSSAIESSLDSATSFANEAADATGRIGDAALTAAGNVDTIGERLNAVQEQAEAVDQVIAGLSTPQTAATLSAPSAPAPTPTPQADPVGFDGAGRGLQLTPFELTSREDRTRERLEEQRAQAEAQTRILEEAAERRRQIRIREQAELAREAALRGELNETALRSLEQAEVDTAELRQELDALVSSAIKARDDSAAGAASTTQDIAEQLGLSLDDVGAGINVVGNNTDGLRQRLTGVGDSGQEALSAIGQASTTTAAEIADQLGVELTEQQQAFFDIGETAVDSFEKAGTGADEASQATEELTESVEDAESATEALGTNGVNSLGVLKDAAESVKLELDGATQSGDELRQATEQLEPALNNAIAQVGQLAAGYGAALTQAQALASTPVPSLSRPTPAPPPSPDDLTTPTQMTQPDTMGSLLGGFTDGLSGLQSSLNTIADNTLNTTSQISKGNKNGVSPDRTFTNVV